MGQAAAIQPELMASEAAVRLARVAGLPAGRVTAIAWLGNGLSHAPTPEDVVAGPDPSLAAHAVERAIRRLGDADRSIESWMAAYVETALRTGRAGVAPCATSWTMPSTRI